MSLKPSDAFLSVIDFFSTLVPGAIVAFLVMEQDWVRQPPSWPCIERGSVEGWAVFLVSAFVLGHFVTIIASGFDRLYDRYYVRWRRASHKHVSTELKNEGILNRAELTGNTSWWRTKMRDLASWWCILSRRILHVWKKTNADDELLKAAKTVKRQQLGDLARDADVNADDVSNTYMWAGTVVRSTIPAGASEIEKLSAQSKLFRSITVILPLAAAWAGSFKPVIIVVWVVALFLSLWRFMRLRWDATQRMYEYFIAAKVLPKGREGKDTS